MPRFARHARDYVVYLRSTRQVIGRYQSFGSARDAQRNEAAFTDRLEADYGIRSIDAVPTFGTLPDDLDYSTL